MTIYAVLADIHGNLPALQAVAEDARHIADTEGNGEIHFINLGDVVDFGPQPNECVTWVHDHCAINVRGNHERVVASQSLQEVYAIHPDYWPITLWTRRILTQRHKETIRHWQTQYRDRGPSALNDFILFHGSLTWGEDHYIDDERSALRNLKRLRILHTNYGLFGHTHIQGYFAEEFGKAIIFLTCPESEHPDRTDGWRPAPIGKWEKLPDHGQAVLLNPGSVGQPRCHPYLPSAGVPHDHRAAYMLLWLNGDGRSFQFRRVSYDVHETIRRLREIRWPDNADDDSLGKSIYKDKETLEHIPQSLHILVRNTLIPMIKPEGEQIDKT